MMKYKTVVFSIMAIFIFGSFSAQTKNEKESRISISEFPHHAQTILNTIPKKAKRIKHYKETDGPKEGFESKFKYKHHWHSVEFNSVGSLEDIEVTIKMQHIPKSVRHIINSYINDHSVRHDILKIQEQYVYDKTISEVQFLKSTLENRQTIVSNYEIIIALKIKKEWILQEITFDSKGTFLNARDLQHDSYEYIMY